MPKKILFEKVTSVLDFEGASQLSWGQENAVKVKVGNSFNIIPRQDREQGPQSLSAPGLLKDGPQL